MKLFGPPDIDYLKRKGKIKDLIKALGYEKDLNVANNAEKALIEIETPMELLKSALENSNNSAKQRIINILGEIGDEQAVKLLIFEIYDEDCSNYASNALKNIKNPKAINGLQNALKNKNELVRECSIAALGNIKNPTAVELLINAFKD